MGRFNKSKKGFPITLFFSGMAYGLAIFLAILILGISGCVLNKDKAESSIQGRAETSSTIRADAQLAGFLRTQIPGRDGLFASLDWLRQKQDEKFEFAQGLDVIEAKDFLERHPESYSGKDYAGFIVSLHAIYMADSKEEKGASASFKAVTTALFLRAKGEGKAKGGQLFYLLPLSVDFENAHMSGCYLNDFDMCASYLPGKIRPQRAYVKATQALPMADRSFAFVEFRYYPEFSAWLPNP